MTHYWIIEADSAHDLAKQLTKEMEAGAQLAGDAFFSASRKHYQPIVRELGRVEKLDFICLDKFEIR